MDTHADEIFKLNAFGLLPEHVVRLILARDGLQADEQVKYNGVYTWCEHYCRSHELTNIADVMRDFLDLIQFHKIPRDVLLSKIYPSRIVPDNIFLSALAYQVSSSAHLVRAVFLFALSRTPTYLPTHFPLSPLPAPL